jgi:aminoglycoside 3-N-acetyltransferase I
MSSSPAFRIHTLGPGDVAVLEAMSTAFGDAFDEVETYSGARPSAGYLERLLGSDCFIALAALKRGQVVGGVAAYQLHKFEQERSEIYIYDLAVSLGHRRQGVASGLIGELKRIAKARRAYVIYVQADRSDEAAIALYESLGRREEVFHYDIPPDE